MSDNFQYLDVNDERYEDAPRALRDAYEKLRKAHQADAQELGKLRGTVRQNTATEVLKAKGYDPKAAKFLIQSGVDLNDENAVDNWLTEDGGFFKVGDAPPAEQAVDHSEEQQARSQIAEASAQVQPAPTEKIKAALAEITPEMTPADVIKVYQKHGI